MNSLWYTGACDRMLDRVLWWYNHWGQGKVHSTRPYFGLTGVTAVVTKRVLSVPFHPREFEHMVRILRALKPEWVITADMDMILPKLSAQPVMADGVRLVPISTYQADVREILETLLKAKAGASPEDELGKLVEKQKPGESLWG